MLSPVTMQRLGDSCLVSLYLLLLTIPGHGSCQNMSSPLLAAQLGHNNADCSTHQKVAERLVGDLFLLLFCCPGGP